MLRGYQKETKEAIYSHLRRRSDAPCAVLPTGSGKTHVMQSIAEDAVDKWNGRVLILSHVRELLTQTASKFKRNDVGLYSAGLNSRDTSQPIIIAGIQSVYRKAGELGPFNLVIVDEAHLIPVEGEGRYRSFLKDAMIVNPKLRVIGMTATPYRMGTGMICAPENILNHVCHQVEIQDLIVQGYLSPVRSKSGKKKLDLSGLHVRGGDYVPHEVAEFMDNDHIIDSAISDIKRCTQDRTSVLIFSPNVRHAIKLHTLLADTEGGAGLVVGTTPAEERNQQIAEFKARRIKYLVSVDVLSTGFDAPNVDCVAMLRPTLSAGVYCQQVGRGFRVDESGIKKDCLILDFVGNIKQHGPIDLIRPRKKGKGNKNSVAPTKECPECNEIISSAYTTCPACNFDFPAEDRKLRHGATASIGDAVLAAQEKPSVFTVRDVRYEVHTKKDASPNAPKTMRVDYLSGVGMRFSEWVCFEHEGFAFKKAQQWWARHSNDPFPENSQHAVDICEAGGVALTLEVSIKYEGKYPRVVDSVLAEKPAKLELFPRASTNLRSIDQEVIPF